MKTINIFVLKIISKQILYKIDLKTTNIALISSLNQANLSIKSTKTIEKNKDLVVYDSVMVLNISEESKLWQKIFKRV